MSGRVLVTGASGLLGRAVLAEFSRSSNWTACGLSFSRAGEGLRQVDLRDEAQVQKVVTEFKPNVIVHSAAERKPDVVENQPDVTRKINVDATRYICQAAAAEGAWVLYISTDYVFDGKNPPYSETSEPNPLNKYGVSKLDGEKVTLQVSPDNGILRIPILYGEITSLDESAVTVLFGKVKVTTEKCVMSDYERRFPAYTGDIAVVCRQLAEKRLVDTNVRGIYHWSGSENMTKYDMAVIMAKAFNLPTDHIEPDRTPGTGTSRPYNSQLSCERAESLGCSQRSKLSEKIKTILEPFMK